MWHEYPRAVEVVCVCVHCMDGLIAEHKFRVWATRCARCAIRAAMSNRCEQGVQHLLLPSSVKKYLLLEPVGIIY